jgi:MFS family permease
LETDHVHPSLDWRTLIPCGLAAFAAAWNVSNVGTLADPLADAYGVTLTAISFIAVVLVAAQTAATFPAGAVVDRLGAHTVTLGSAALMSVGNLAALTVPDPAVALVSRTVVGVGCAAAWVGGSELVRAASTSPLAQGLFGGIGLAGAGSVLAVLPALEPHFGWRTPYVTALVLALVAGLGLLTVRGVGRTGVEQRLWDTPVDRLFVDRRLYKIALLLAVGVGMTLVLGNWIVPFLHRAGYSQVTAGAIGSLILLGGVASRPLGGWFALRHGRRTRAMLAVALIAGSLGTAVIAAAPSPPLAAVATAVVGIAGGLVFAPSFTGAARARQDAPGASLGFVGATSNVFVVVCTPLLAATFTLPGEGQIGFAIAGAVWLVPLLALPTTADLGLAEVAEA